MNWTYLLIQIIGLIGAGLYFLSFQFKNSRQLFTVQLLSYVFYCTHLFLLGASTGALSYILNLVRSGCLASKSKFANSKWMCIILCVLQVVVATITWNGWITLLPIVANIASTIGGYTRNPQKIRIAGMFFNSPLWILYDIIIGSWAGIVDELLSEASMIISIYRYGWKNLDTIDE